jgi:hypothetical protein
MREHAVRWLVWLLWLIAIAIAIGAELLLFVGGAEPASADAGTRVGDGLLAAQPVVVSSVGAMIAVRQPRNPIAWSAILGALGTGAQAFAQAYATYGLLIHPSFHLGGEMAAWAWTWLDAATWPTLFLVLLLFPDGRLLSPRWRAVAWPVVAIPLLVAVVRAVAPGPLYPTTSVENPFGLTGGAGDVLRSINLYVSGNLLGLLFFPAVLPVILRFRRARGLERLQLKWFAYAVGLTAVAVLFATTGLLGTAANAVVTLAVYGIPVAIGIAILRYRLYDIDLIIRRTLVYGAITASLALVYFGSVVVLQRSFLALTGQRSDLAIVGSTLAVAAMFTPVRRAFQTFVDRRFYRTKYDAARVVATFSAAARDEVELASLIEQLSDVVREAMQPAHVSLWLRPIEREPRRIRPGEVS